MQKLKSLNIIFLGFILGQIALAAVFSYLVNTNGTSDAGEDSGLGMILPFIVIGAFGAAYTVYNSRKATGAAIENLEEKVGHYVQSALLRLSVMEGANLMVLVLMYVQNDLSYLTYFALGLLGFLYFRPSRNQLINDYELSVSEQNELQNV
jgi:hypothetical protein